jgi:hypothetical protein
MYDSKTSNNVCAWATEVDRQENRGLVLDRNMELSLEVDKNNCSYYYLIDRGTATFFWLTEYINKER